MMERALRFGEADHLVGILTDPDPEPGFSSEERSQRPAVIFLNSGLLHRAGASRLHVRMARALAREGFPSLRFDFSGIGDSEPRPDRKSFRESAILETRKAMDLMEKLRGSRTFVLVGLCSGADVAFWTAQVDERVVGLAQLDAFAYPTARFYLRRYLPRLLSPRAWRASVRSRVRGLLGVGRCPRGSEEEEGKVRPEYRRRFPPRDDVAEGLRSLSARGLRFYLFFTGGQGDSLNYAEQYEESFPDVDFGGRIRVDYLPEADHTVTALEHQGFVSGALVEWARQHWPAPVGVSTP